MRQTIRSHLSYDPKFGRQPRYRSDRHSEITLSERKTRLTSAKPALYYGDSIAASCSIGFSLVEPVEINAGAWYLRGVRADTGYHWDVV